ncbi:MAG: FAD-binding protein [Rickettsiales bacterium]|nr:FAD-binding protein [Rickettsiales bacterium]
MSALVIAEHAQQTLAAATASAVTAAGLIDEVVDVLVVGQQARAVAEQAAKLSGIRQVILVDAEHYAQPLAEELSLLIRSLAGDYTTLLAAASTFGKDLMPRVAALLDVQQVSDIIKVVAPDTYVHPIYAGNALETLQSLEKQKVLTVRPTAFAKAAQNTQSVTIVESPAMPAVGLTQFVRLEGVVSARPELTNARIVVSGGRGLGSKESFQLIERLADKLGAAIGASRAAVDAGYVPNDYQVGQTGKVVAPDLYIAVGISGAIQHLAGMKDSKIIVAINKDENAPIFEVADYGLVGDLFELLPKLEQLL